MPKNIFQYLEDLDAHSDPRFASRSCHADYMLSDIVKQLTIDDCNNYKPELITMSLYNAGERKRKWISRILKKCEELQKVKSK